MYSNAAADRTDTILADPIRNYFFFANFILPFKKNRISILNYYGANKSEYKTTRLRIKLEGYVGT